MKIPYKLHLIGSTGSHTGTNVVHPPTVLPSFGHQRRRTNLLDVCLIYLDLRKEVTCKRKWNKKVKNSFFNKPYLYWHFTFCVADSTFGTTLTQTPSSRLRRRQSSKERESYEWRLTLVYCTPEYKRLCVVTKPLLKLKTHY